MSSARQSQIDRQKQEIGIKIDKDTYKLAKVNQEKVDSMLEQIQTLEDIIEEMINETREG